MRFRPMALTAAAGSGTPKTSPSATAHACPSGTSITSYRLVPAAVAATSVATPARR